MALHHPETMAAFAASCAKADVAVVAVQDLYQGDSQLSVSSTVWLPARRGTAAVDTQQPHNIYVAEDQDIYAAERTR